MNRGIRAVLFDFAGTLFAPRPTVECVRLAGERTGFALSDAEAADLAERYLAAGFPGAPYPADVPAHLVDAYARRDLGPGEHRTAYVGLLSTVPSPVPGFTERLYEQILSPDGWVPYADAHEVVTGLIGRGLRVGVISNVGFDLRPVLRHHGLAELAERSTFSFEHGFTKPDPRLFAQALKSLEATADETLMVGDHAEADAGGEALGIRTVIWPMSPPGAIHGLRRVLDEV